MWVEGARQVAHPSLLCYHTLCSMLGAVERDFVPSVDVHPERRVTSDHEHPLDLGCSVWILIIYSQVSIHIAQCTL